MKTKLALILLAAALSACARADNGVRVTSSPQVARASRSEPVNYNGRVYQVSLRFAPEKNAHRVTVAAPGRALGGTAGDRMIVEQVAKSTVRHFACPGRQKGRIIPGTQRHAHGKWHMLVRCG